MGSQGRLLTIREAADALGISVETLRRWAESGRIQVERTTGGHRRFAPAEVQRLRGVGGTPLRPVAPPDDALPLLAELLASAGDRLGAAAVQRLYPPRVSGWFAEHGVDPGWCGALVAASRTGEWAVAIYATRRLMERAGRQGASLLERHGFLENFGALALRELVASSPSAAEIAGAQRLFAALRQRVLFEEDGESRAAREQDGDAILAPLTELLDLPDLDWAAVYEADPERLELELRAHAGVEGGPPPAPQRFSFGVDAVGRVALSRRATLERAEGPVAGPVALAPMLLDGELTGVLALGLRRARPVGEAELSLLEALGGAFARARRGRNGGRDSLQLALSAFRAGWAADGRYPRAV